MSKQRNTKEQPTKASATELDEGELQAIEGGAALQGRTNQSLGRGAFKGVDGLSSKVGEGEASSKTVPTENVSFNFNKID